jgi:hypothetical protein
MQSLFATSKQLSLPLAHVCDLEPSGRSGRFSATVRGTGIEIVSRDPERAIRHRLAPHGAHYQIEFFRHGKLALTLRSVGISDGKRRSPRGNKATLSRAPPGNG